MEVLSAQPREEPITVGSYYPEKDLDVFDEATGGVKGLLDSGITKLPKIFVVPENLTKGNHASTDLQVPVIDMAVSRPREEVVDQLRMVAETWGIFQITNHGVPVEVIDGLFDGIRRFHEQPAEAKMQFYGPDHSKPVRYHSGEKFLKYRTWRDTLSCHFHDDTIRPELLPIACRKEVEEYMNCMLKLRDTLVELLSEALGLSSDYLASTDCLKSETLQCHYYPICPQPELTLGLNNHTDPNLITVLAQDQIGGLQAFHDNQWLDVAALHGALVVNVGDFLQLITNDKFKSAVHRVVARTGERARISAACFFYPSTKQIFKAHGPIKELLSDENQPKYKDVIYGEYAKYQTTKGECCGEKSLPHFM